MYRSEAGSLDDAMFSDYPVFKSCIDGDVHTLSSYLNSRSTYTILEDPIHHLTPVHWAAKFGRLDCVRQVASVNPSVINIQSSKSFKTALHCAAEGGHHHCILWLLQAGCNPEVKDISGETALHKAARVGSSECASLLVSMSSSVSAQNLVGQTASALADLSGYPAIATFIRGRELSGVIEFQSRRLQSRSLCSIPRMNRKRMRDTICDDDFCKRIRSDGASEEMQNFFDTMDSINTSLVEHQSMCWSEWGYGNSLVDALIADFEGH